MTHGNRKFGYPTVVMLEWKRLRLAGMHLACQKWRDNQEGSLQVSRMPQNQAVGRTRKEIEGSRRSK